MEKFNVNKFEQNLIKRNEKWIKASNKTIKNLELNIELEKICVENFKKQNRELKGRC